MGENLRPGRQNHCQSLRYPAKIWGQNLTGNGWIESVDGLDDTGEMPCSAVRQIIAIHRRDDGMSESHGRDGASHPDGLVPVDTGCRSARGHSAKAAAAGADLPQDHEGRRAVLAPALVDVGTACLLADGVELQTAHQIADLVILLGSGQANA